MLNYKKCDNRVIIKLNKGLMSSLPDRNLRYFTTRRIIFRRDPITDIPSERFWWGDFYEDGTHQCYDLFRSKARITTYKSLKWHLLVIWYLNQNLLIEDIEEIARVLVDKSNGFITFTTSDEVFSNIIQEVNTYDFELAPKNRSRKIIFKEGCGLSITEKLSIVGKIIGRGKKIGEDEIYDAMLYLNDSGQKITISKLANVLECSTRTIHRNISDDLKKEKQTLNTSYEKVQRNKLCEIQE